ncbi:MAG: YicC family protein [Mucilaginibacter polytrichastri]|nr:YicC family protein [Mucilaginibacter polytrichastri]
MTGYGSANGDIHHVRYTVEIKSLNSKFLELNLKLPKSFAEKEFAIRTDASRMFERGKVMLSISTETSGDEQAGARINTPLFKAYYQNLKELTAELGESSPDIIGAILRMPDVISYEENAVSDEEWAFLQKLITRANDDFQRFRAQEGAVLNQELGSRIGNILHFLKDVEKAEPNRIPVIRERLDQFLSTAIGAENVDRNRLEQELIYYIDKLDITEEKVRLKSHCDYFLETLASEDANGKKLGFISQEIGREINTMGSKANDAAMQKAVVGMKEELEKVKEQLLNVL